MCCKYSLLMHLVRSEFFLAISHTDICEFARSLLGRICVYSFVITTTTCPCLQFIGYDIYQRKNYTRGEIIYLYIFVQVFNCDCVHIGPVCIIIMYRHLVFTLCLIFQSEYLTRNIVWKVYGTNLVFSVI